MIWRGGAILFGGKTLSTCKQCVLNNTREKGKIMTMDAAMPQGPQPPRPEFNPNEYLKSMGIPQDIIAQGDDAIRNYAQKSGLNLVPKGQVPSR